MGVNRQAEKSAERLYIAFLAGSVFGLFYGIYVAFEVLRNLLRQRVIYTVIR
jgi:hypothetical protein